MERKILQRCRPPKIYNIHFFMIMFLSKCIDMQVAQRFFLISWNIQSIFHFIK